MALMTGTTGDFVKAMLTSQPYKPGSGKWARNGTLTAIVLLIVGGVYSWNAIQVDSDPVTAWVLPLVVGLVAAWVGFRLVHYPVFADFLISTQAEIVKVSWPSWTEVKVSTWVVLANVVVLAGFLFAADIFWGKLLEFLGVLKIGAFVQNSQGMFFIPPQPMLSQWASWLVG